MKHDVDTLLTWLKQHGTTRTRDGMARYALPSDKAFGVTVGEMRQLAKRIGRDHQLAAGLWTTGWYEARMVASMVDDPARVTPAQMDRWCRDFDSWGICDTVCFTLFDRTPHAWTKVAKWSTAKEEFVRRAAFALIACMATHDKTSNHRPFLDSLPLIERAATDDRNFVKKAVSWALRGVGIRSRDLNTEALRVARRLAVSENGAARWVGKDAVRYLTSPAVARRLEKRAKVG